jgi:UDP-N-acetylmuramoyl-tripeptide--D-alanyl-D-alanine ligase
MSNKKLNIVSANCMKTEHLYQLYLKHPVICTDTRKISGACLFFALKGDHFDANEFALKALEDGAAYAIIDDKRYAVNERYILVKDVLISLQQLAAYHRQQLRIPVIGITGSNGKTTTKELIRSVLAKRFRVYATEGNLNNHIGVPLTLLAVTPDCEIAVIEMGANHQKEIEFLCGLAQPGYGLITNVGKAHLEGFGSLEGVRKAKGELYDHLSRTSGVVFINADNPLLLDMAWERKMNNTIRYGSAKENYIHASLAGTIPFLKVVWQGPSQEQNFAESNLPGIYNFENILAAICIGSFFKLSAEEINRGINDYIPNNHRSQILKTDQNVIICDYYNANPGSMAVAIDNLNTLPEGNKALILGDMFELGQEASTEHRQILEKAMQTSSQRRIFIGEEFYKLKNDSAEFYSNTSEAEEALKNKSLKNYTILLKGSRGMKLEALLNYL